MMEEKIKGCLLGIDLDKIKPYAMECTKSFIWQVLIEIKAKNIIKMYNKPMMVKKTPPPFQQKMVMDEETKHILNQLMRLM